MKTTYKVSTSGSIPIGTLLNPLKLQSTLVLPHKHFVGHFIAVTTATDIHSINAVIHRACNDMVISCFLPRSADNCIVTFQQQKLYRLFQTSAHIFR